MSTKSPECYTTEPQARCLRVEISPGRSLLLPLDQFTFAEFISADKEQQLRLVFATHEVVIRGLRYGESKRPCTGWNWRPS